MHPGQAMAWPRPGHSLAMACSASLRNSPGWILALLGWVLGLRGWILGLSSTSMTAMCSYNLALYHYKTALCGYETGLQSCNCSSCESAKLVA